MTPHDTAPPPANQVPNRTTPTWEMELLLSGATVFALIQLAGLVPEWSAYLLPRLADPWLEIVRLLLVYGHAAIIMLVITFLMHLVLRAYWVALVGMNSVYPGGLRLDRLHAGPIAKRIVSARWQDFASAIEAADNRATIVFGLGIGLVLVLVPVVVLAVTLFLLALAMATLLGDPDRIGSLMMLLMVAWVLPYLLASWADRHWGDRMPADGLFHRICRWTLLSYSLIGLGREASPLITLFGSNIGERRANMIVGGLLAFIIVLSLIVLSLGGDDLGPGNYGEFPEGQNGLGQVVRDGHYAATQQPGETPTMPFLPDFVARGPYLPLVVPFVPDQHGHLLARCDGLGEHAGTLAEQQVRHAKALACLTKGFQVALDGEMLAVAPTIYTDARRDLRGLLYMIPMRNQVPGQHELRVHSEPAQAPAADDSSHEYRIPFWR